MSIEDYCKLFVETYFSFDTTDWHYDYYLNLDNPDKPSLGKNGQFSWCGYNCERHELTLTSSVDQEVYVTAHTWDSRNMAESCANRTSSKMHSIKLASSDTAFSFRYGSHQLEGFTMKANESVKIITEWNWTDPNHEKDWSVTVWAPDGEVLITHNEGRSSDTMPVIDRQNEQGQTETNYEHFHDGKFTPPDLDDPIVGDSGPADILSEEEKTL